MSSSSASASAVVEVGVGVERKDAAPRELLRQWRASAGAGASAPARASTRRGAARREARALRALRGAVRRRGFAQLRWLKRRGRGAHLALAFTDLGVAAPKLGVAFCAAPRHEAGAVRFFARRGVARVVLVGPGTAPRAGTERFSLEELQYNALQCARAPRDSRVIKEKSHEYDEVLQRFGDPRKYPVLFRNDPHVRLLGAAAGDLVVLQFDDGDAPHYCRVVEGGAKLFERIQRGQIVRNRE
jgi:hypothetical protein